jgi:hypothetical protein
MLFSRRNYVMLAVGVLLIAFGFTIMRIENAVDGVMSLYVAPLLILAGYVEIIFAIIWQPREPAEAQAEQTAA